MKKYYAYIVMLFISSQLFSQDVIKGVIIDKDGLTMPGVNIVNEKTSASTVSDFDGNFTIKTAVGEVLKFSMVGYETVTKKASLNMSITIDMGEAQKLDEVVLVGFGTKKKGAVTGSVTQLKAETIMQTPAKSAMQSIQGKAAGVNIVSNDEPGGNPTVIIRGMGTITGARNPLYVIDGVQTDGLNGLSQNDIATMDILKDAASTAAISNFPYTPVESMKALRFFYENWHQNLIGVAGPYDAFSPQYNWVTKRYLAIDQGTIVPMIENHRTGMLWNLFMQAPEVKAGLKNLGFSSTQHGL